MIYLFLILPLLLEILLLVQLQLIHQELFLVLSCQTIAFLRILYQMVNHLALQIFETCVQVNNNLCGKLVSSLVLSIKFYERFKVTLVLFFCCFLFVCLFVCFIADFNLLSCELDHFMFKVLYLVISYYIKTKQQNYTLTVPVEKHCRTPCSFQTSSKVNLLYCFCISIQFVLLA